MKAVVRQRYGGPEVLELRELEQPVPADDEVLVRVGGGPPSIPTTGITRREGVPYVMRPQSGLRRPKHRDFLGADVAGTVEAVGPDVSSLLTPGDEVFRIRRVGRLRRVRGSSPRGGHRGAQAGQPEFRAGGRGGRWPGRRRCSSSATTPGPPGRPERADARRLGWRRHVRRAARQALRRRGDRLSPARRTSTSSGRSVPST